MKNRVLFLKWARFFIIGGGDNFRTGLTIETSDLMQANQVF